ncbi:MAG TPA: GH1 family beta-glucosidase [Candidatus Limnocylindrales bacterium]|nr:GH1 family beta-glucosidase [Candidatus Limnocylindrales bacterium]
MPNASSTFQTDPARLTRAFPPGFAWGFAASAYQVEGAAAEDGRGPSIWDTFARTPGAISDGSTGDVACDHYHRYREDVRLMADLGARAYRFSISWPRVMPLGRGTANQAGLDFYDRLVDALLGVGVQPLANLFHWDLPQALQDRGGFANPEVVAWFAEYATVVASRLSDRVTDWMTFNEPAVFAFLGHAEGIHAPGLRDWPTAIRVADNELRSHAAAVQAIRAVARDARIGVAVDVNQVAPATSTERDRIAAERWSSARDAWFLDPLFGRGYPALGLDAHREAGHLEGVELTDPPLGDLDYVGLNYYRRDSVSARSDRAFDWEIGAAPGSEQTQMGWHVAPDGLRDVLLELNRTYAPREIVVTENGAAYPDTVDPDGNVRDGARLAYLARHVAAAADALLAGVPLTGYFVWSLLDNFEWSLGFSRRFGLVHVDFGSQGRTPKDSARWYRRLITGE